jgi:zinc D-Ala-D-Ala carboxypeptidase
MPKAKPLTLRYFTRAEFRCKHCAIERMDDEFLRLLDELRHRCGFPLPVTSGYRCPVHNQRVSSTGPDGPHTWGRAADLGVSRHRAYDVLRHALALGFTGIGVQQKGPTRFIHLDTLTEQEAAPRPTVWSY